VSTLVITYCRAEPGAGGPGFKLALFTSVLFDACCVGGCINKSFEQLMKMNEDAAAIINNFFMIICFNFFSALFQLFGFRCCHFKVSLFLTIQSNIAAKPVLRA
jgi:hypothetical protein